MYSHSCFALTRARRPKQETVFMILQVWTFVLYQISWPPKIAGNGTDNIFYIWKALQAKMLLDWKYSMYFLEQLLEHILNFLCKLYTGTAEDKKFKIATF